VLDEVSECVVTAPRNTAATSARRHSRLTASAAPGFRTVRPSSHRSRATPETSAPIRATCSEAWSSLKAKTRVSVRSASAASAGARKELMLGPLTTVARSPLPGRAGS
jgi:hypothetical protein